MSEPLRCHDTAPQDDAMSGDSITVVRARARRLAKLVRAAGGIDDYDLARTVDLIAVRVLNLDAVAGLLGRLLARPDCAVVRGIIADPARVTGVRRLVHADKNAGDAPTLLKAAHQWLALDVEGVGRPLGIPASDIPTCAQEAIRRLPEAFHGVRCIAQASAGHGIKPGVRMRLWYWLTRPATGPELKRWLRGTCADPSVFRPAQLIYTAAPIFVGRTDHLPVRIALLPGTAAVSVPAPATLAPPPMRPQRPTIHPNASGAQRYALFALTHAAARVAGAGEGRRHDTLVAEARGLARLITSGLLSASEVNRSLGNALRQAGKTQDEATAALAWAIDHPSVGFVPETHI